MRISTFLEIVVLFIAWSVPSLLLLACLLYFFPVPRLSALSILSIGVPALMLGTFLVLVFWVFKGKAAFLFPLLSLLCAFLCFGTIYRFGGVTKADPKAASLKVITYNVRSMQSGRVFRFSKETNDSTVAIIRDQSPDILCLQEFPRASLKDLKFYRDWYITPPETGKVSQAIFSKYHIINVGAVPFPESANNTIYADIQYGKDTIRVYNVHLQSYRIYGSLRYIARSFGIGLLNRMDSAIGRQQQQARLVKAHQETSPYPSIICGDLNSTAFSNTYRVMKRGMQDSFQETGRGWGTTYRLGRGIPFRIDFILASEAFEFRSHMNYDLRLSDHSPVGATLEAKIK